MENQFQITSGIIVASDPCYSIPTWCQGIIEGVKNGTWKASIKEKDEKDWGIRIARLTIEHTGSKAKGKRQEIPSSFGVDSGQFGFFDKSYYRSDESAKELPKYNFGDNYDREEGDEWYRAICNLTLAEKGWGVIPNGAVSTSGFGDGSYGVYGWKNGEGEWIKFEVIYI